VTSVNGCEQFKPEPCFIVAHEAQTGKERWDDSNDEGPVATPLTECVIGPASTDAPSQRGCFQSAKSSGWLEGAGLETNPSRLCVMRVEGASR
jgi:hypothetical protein